MFTWFLSALKRKDPNHLGSDGMQHVVDAGRWGWAGSVADFVETGRGTIFSALVARHPAGTKQEQSWNQTIDELKTMFARLSEQIPAAITWWLFLEYGAPRASDRPIDACLLCPGAVLVLEVKNTETLSKAAVDQIRGHVRDMEAFHEGCSGLQVVPYIAWSGAKGLTEMDGIASGPIDALAHVATVCNERPLDEADAHKWGLAPYRPLPPLVDAARTLFEHGALPQIKTIPQQELARTLALLHHHVGEARQHGRKTLILLSGVPGSGKSLVGLQTVHDLADGQPPQAVFLSGNGPLIETLQYQLKSKVFVQDVHNFINEYGSSEDTPPESFVVFDEAQRAWDAEWMTETNRKKRRQLPDVSEPALLLRIMSRRSGGACVLALIGPGQSINKGEQAGPALWADAATSTPGWQVVASPDFADELGSHENATFDAALRLDHSVRSQLASELHLWVESVIVGDAGSARAHKKNLDDSHFVVRRTRDLEQGKQLLRDRYEDRPDATYGIVASSKAGNLAAYGYDMGWLGAGYPRVGRRGPWFSSKRGSPAQCTTFHQAAQEFQCQGLELDAAMVAWGRDFRRQGSEWLTRAKVVKGVRDPFELRQNAYRVLLTRSRDGMILWVPPDEELDETYDFLGQCGVPEI